MCEESASADCVIYTGEGVVKRSVDVAGLARST